MITVEHLPLHSKSWSNLHSFTNLLYSFSFSCLFTHVSTNCQDKRNFSVIGPLKHRFLRESLDETDRTNKWDELEICSLKHRFSMQMNARRVLAAQHLAWPVRGAVAGG